MNRMEPIRTLSYRIPFEWETKHNNFTSSSLRTYDPWPKTVSEGTATEGHGHDK